MAEDDPWAFEDGGDSEQAPAAGGETSTSVAGTPAAAATPAQKGGSDAGSIHGGGSIAGGGSLAAEGGGGGEESQETAAAPPPPPEDDGYRKPVQLYRHWVRPKFLQYKYMYNYRTNYYDDVIDYLDKKQHGVSREIPRPQTWAERVLRTKNATGRDLDMYAPTDKRDHHLVQTLAASIRGYNYHTKAYLNQKYGHVI